MLKLKILARPQQFHNRHINLIEYVEIEGDLGVLNLPGDLRVEDRN
jgi:hypothetical protein